MAFVTFLLSLLARKVNDIIQAVFGWSVTTLFGRMVRRQQVLVTGALVLALVWPVFIAGVFAPGVASWAIAMVPLHHWIGEPALRIVWLVVALAAPIGVGALVRVASPRAVASWPMALLRGYPVALGFALAFVVIVVTVPIVKIASLVRRWSDEHVYVQPRDGEYEHVLAALADACRRAGLEPDISDAPRAMELATLIMRFFARGAVAPFVGDRLRRVTADGVELYLYPGDLLMRGEKFRIARIRAMLGRTELDAHAYLVSSDDGKAIQDMLSQTRDALARVRRRTFSSAPDVCIDRLKAVYRRMIHADVTFEEWGVLDGIARKLERRMLAIGIVAGDALPIDAAAEPKSPRAA